jgi:hypothetical protein
VILRASDSGSLCLVGWIKLYPKTQRELLNKASPPPQIKLHSLIGAFESENVLDKTFLALENTSVKHSKKAASSRGCSIKTRILFK